MKLVKIDHTSDERLLHTHEMLSQTHVVFIENFRELLKFDWQVNKMNERKIIQKKSPGATFKDFAHILRRTNTAMCKSRGQYNIILCKSEDCK